MNFRLGIDQGLTDLGRGTHQDAIDAVFMDEGLQVVGIDEVGVQGVSCVSEGFSARRADAVVGQNVHVLWGFLWKQP